MKPLVNESRLMNSLESQIKSMQEEMKLMRAELDLIKSTENKMLQIYKAFESDESTVVVSLGGNYPVWCYELRFIQKNKPRQPQTDFFLDFGLQNGIITLYMGSDGRFKSVLFKTPNTDVFINCVKFITKNLDVRVTHYSYGSAGKKLVFLQRCIKRWLHNHKYHDLYCQVLGVPADHNSMLGRLYPNGGYEFRKLEADINSK